MVIFPYPFPARLPYPAVLHPTLPDRMQDIHALVSLSMYAPDPTTPHATYLCAYVATYSAAIWAQDHTALSIASL